MPMPIFHPEIAPVRPGVVSTRGRIPPVIVEITALPFVPLLRAMAWIVARERREL